MLHLFNGVKEAVIAMNSTTTRIQMAKSILSMSKVAYYENGSNESHISNGQEFSAIWHRSANGALEAFR